MTKKHFIRAAELVKSRVDAGHIDGPAVIADAFVELFSAYNDRFDRDRFLVACGLQEPAPKQKRAR